MARKERVSVARAGEYLTASVLEERGVRAVFVDIDGADLWAYTPSGEFVTVQVKTASVVGPNEPKRRTGRYWFQKPGSPDVDVFALVALDLRLIRFFRNIGATKTVNETMYDENAMQDDITKFFKLKD